MCLSNVLGTTFLWENAPKFQFFAEAKNSKAQHA